MDGKDDAVGLMKHWGDHAASAYAQAEEILSNHENNLAQIVTPARAWNSNLNEDNRDWKENILNKNFRRESSTQVSSYSVVWESVHILI